MDSNYYEESIDPEERELPVSASSATPRQLLVAWANEQDAWVRHIVSHVLAAKQPLSSEQIAESYSEFLTEKGLADGPSLAVPMLEDEVESAHAEDRLELVSLSGIEGVNALAANQAIEFDPSITILFGENGSGKTGYARILKRLAAVRTAETILPDINSRDAAAEPAANVTFKIGSEVKNIRWRNEAGLTPFTRMSVFDAPCVTIHVDSELNYVYTPVELALFAHVGDAIRAVQRLVDAEAAALKSTGNPFISRFNRGSRIYPLIETLGSTSDMAELTALGTLVDGDRERHVALEAEISALRGSGLGAMYATAAELAARLERLVEFLELVVDFNAAAYETARGALIRVRETRRQARDELFGADELAGSPDDQWQHFVSEAEHYREHLGLTEYPLEDDRCLYCRQELDETALALVRRYRRFLDDTLASQVVEAEKTIHARVFSPGALSLEVVRSDLAALKLLDPVPAFVTNTLTLLSQAEDTVKATTENAAAPYPDIASAATTLLAVVKEARKQADASAKSLAEQKADSAQALRKRESEFLELDARVTLNQVLSAVGSYVSSAKRASRLTSLSKALSPMVLKRLTELSKVASEDLVNQDFERLFREECQALRAPAVGLEFQGRRGKAERKKAVAQYKPSAVLSEGEQKVIALSDFLAEGRMGSANAPIIFDDPVTSLDYRRIGEVANRISLLGDTHQVVVLTHNIMFASTLLGMRTSKKLRCKFYEIRDEETRKGLVQPAGEPRSDTCGGFEKKINALLQTIRTSAEAVVREALLCGAYGLLRSWCEAFVEQEVLQNVSQRYRVNVMMTNLSKIKADRLANTAVRLMPIFDRCSRFMPGHSSPMEQLNVQPKLSDFEADYTEAKAIRQEYLLG